MRIYQRSKSPYWQWRWTPPGSGKELRGSCRTTDREEAERYVIGLQADWRQAELLGQVPAITIDELFAKLVTDHYAFKKSTKAPLSVLANIKQITDKKGLRYVHQIEKNNLNDIVLSFKHRALSQEIKPSTVNFYLRILRHAINYTNKLGFRTGAVTKDTWKDHMFPATPPRTKFYSAEQFAKLLDELPDHQIPLVIIAVQTGLRAGNLMNLREENLDFEKDEITVHVKSEQLEGKKVTIGMGVSLRTYLLELCAKNRVRTNRHSHLFLYLDPITREYRPFKSYKTAFNKARKRAGLEGYTFHDLRHTCATWLLEQGYSLIDAKEQLGHSSVVTTQKYAHTTEERKRARTEAISHIIQHTNTDDSVQHIETKRKRKGQATD
jgi:integrase